jgi:hypothetical protein
MQNKQRVLALDYFRGICMIAVIINHFSLFANPLTVLAGGGRLWVGAAELFFLISGITFGIVRGSSIKHKLSEVIIKSFRRAGLLYGVYIATVVASLGIAFILSAHNLPVNIPGALPAGGVGHTAWQILTLKYSYGWADFLMYYAVILLLAPFALQALVGRFWSVVPVVSLCLFLASAVGSVHANNYVYFLVWQAYFFAGLTLARFRLPILGWFNRSNDKVKSTIGYGLVAFGALIIAISAMSAHSARILASPLPGLIKSMSSSIARASTTTDFWLNNNRTGLGRLAVALLTLSMLYIIYQRYKKPILNYSGNFVMAFGRNSLQIFVLQALAIPIVSALPMRRDSALLNTGLCAALVFSMWLFTHKWSPVPSINSAFQSFYASIINTSYLAASTARGLRNRIFSPVELD